MKLIVLGDARSIHLQRNLAGLASRGLDIRLITHNPSPIPGVSVERFAVPPLSWRHRGRWRSRWTSHLRELLRSCDVLNVQFLHDWGLTPEIMDEGCVVATPWGSDIVPPFGEDPPTEELMAIRRTLLRSAALVTAWGPTFARQTAEYASLSPDAIHIVPLGVDTTLFRPPATTGRRSSPSGTAGLHSAKPPTHNHCYQVGYFKGFRPVYRAAHFVHAASQVARMRQDVQFTMIGAGVDLEPCRALAQSLSIHDRIRWVPPLAHAQLARMAAEWDLAAVTSSSESFCVAALEANAVGIPVVATDVGGLRDVVIHERTGILVHPQCTQALAAAMVELLVNTQTRRAMGALGRQRVHDAFEQSRVLDMWVAAYLRACDRSACST